MKVLVEIERDDSDKAVSLFGTHRDVTDRKEAEIASIESNRLVNEIMSIFPGSSTSSTSSWAVTSP